MTEKPLYHGRPPLPKNPDVVKRVIEAAGGEANLARTLGLSRQAIHQWERIPPLRAAAISKATGIPISELCPDIFP